jgi:hypothetical protein
VAVEEPEGIEVQLAIELPPELEVGVPADFANLWHSPNSFILDFVSVTRPQGPPKADERDGKQRATIEAKVAARVRIAPEQVFLLIQGLQAQADAWLKESGRAAPPDSWNPGGVPDQVSDP